MLGNFHVSMSFNLFTEYSFRCKVCLHQYLPVFKPAFRDWTRNGGQLEIKRVMRKYFVLKTFQSLLIACFTQRVKYGTIIMCEEIKVMFKIQKLIKAHFLANM